MSAGDWAAWAGIALGLLLAAAGLRATFYFWRAHRAVSSWVTGSIYRTVLTITAVALGLTLSRALQLVFGPSPWAQAASGLLVVWLLLLPFFLMREFRQHEGAPVDHEETEIQQEDREVGNERRQRQAENE